MSLEEYLQLISYTNICKYNDDDVYSYAFKNKPVPELNFFEFDIDQAFLTKNSGGFDILVNQMGERLKYRKRADKKLEFDPSWFSIMLCRKNPDTSSQFPLLFVKSFVSTNYQVSMEVERQLLEPG